MASNNECEKCLARLISTIVKYGTQIEDTRMTLANNENFNPFAAFKRINFSGTGYITEDDLDEFLKYYGLYATQEDLRQFFPSEKNTLTKITYNSFLNQVLPVTDIDLRNRCLERATKHFNEDEEAGYREVDRLITSIYQKEIEYTKILEANKNKLASYNYTLLEAAFASLTDDVTNYISFKSVSQFMKQYEYSFGKKEYECFIKRIDKNFTNKVTPTDFKYQLFPLVTLTDPANRSIAYQENSRFEGISPIKSSFKGSPNKHNASGEIKIPAQSNKTPEGSAYGDRDLTPPRGKQGASSPDIRIPSAEKKRSSSPYDKRGNRLPVGKGASKTPDRMRGTSSQGNFYNQEIAAINENIMLQNAPESTFSNNPLEYRYLDPTYHSYWNYHREHNTTLSPDYFKKVQSRTANDYLHQSGQYSKPGTNGAPYFNPSYIEPGTSENYHRYPDNPFRFTDHGHFFKNYYAGLRNNYYDTYYNYVPYKVKAPLNKAGMSFNPSRTSPVRFRDYDANNPGYLAQYQRNPQNIAEGQINGAPSLEKLSRYSPMRRREFVANPEAERFYNYAAPKASNADYQYVVIPGPKAGKSGAKIGRQGTVELEVPPPRSLLDDFMPRVELDTATHVPSGNNKPYSFVVVKGQN